MPMRSFTVTGTSPAPATAPATTSWNRRRRQGRADPPPWRVTLRTGHPKLRSTCSAPSSFTRRLTAACITVGSVPYSWMDRGDSPGPNRASLWVFSWPSTRPRAAIISLT